MKILEIQKADFFILDDGTSAKTLVPLITFLNQHTKNVCVLSLKEISRKLFKDIKRTVDFNDICFVGLGQGGTIILNYMFENSKNYISSQNIRWSRQWVDRDNFDFIKDNLDKSFYCGKKVIFIEDVVASGKTVQEASNDFEKLGANVMGVVAAIINENSPALKAGFTDFALYGVHVHSLSYKSDSLDTHWFPPIYSLRHLLYGEQENPFFYQILSEKYSFPLDQLRNAINKIMPDS